MTNTLIEEFWIINFDGIPFYSYSPRGDIQSNLLGGFFSAIQSFAQQLSKGSKKDKFINSIALGKHLFIFLVNKKYKLYFISKSKTNISEKTMNKHLKVIEEMFIESFEIEIENFDGEINKFFKFNKKFEEYFKDNFTKLKGMW